MKHTPAPWYISTPGRLDALYVGPVVVSSHRTALGRDASHPELLNHIDNDTLYANAELIAASPDLLAALQALVSAAAPHLTSKRYFWRDGADGESSEYCEEVTEADELDAARAAIAKATGEAP